MVAMKDAFNADHANNLNEMLSDLAPMKTLKVLKGADREKWCRVIGKARGAVCMVIFACVSNELLPYFERLRSSIKAHEMLNEPMLGESCSLCHLADSGHGEEILLGKLKDLNEFLKDMNRRLCDPEPLAEKDASTLTTTWVSKSTATFACLAECATKAHKEGLDPECKLKECAYNLAAEKEKLGQTLEESLKGHLRDRSLSHIQECFLILRNAVLSAGEVRPESKDNFYNKMEAAQLVSTVLGAEGNAIRQGMDVSCVLLECMMAYDAVVRECSSTDERMAAVVVFLKGCKDLSVVDYISALKEMNKSFPVSCLSDKDYEDMTNIVSVMFAKKDTEFQAIVAYHKEKLDAAYIPEADVEIPDPFMKIEQCADVKPASVSCSFSMEKTQHLSTKASELEKAISAVETAAKDMGIDTIELIELPKYKGSYRSTIRWLLTGNVLYLLVSKAVTRAMLAGSGVSEKAKAQLMSCIKTAVEHDVELPQGIHACVTLICGESRAATQV